MEAEPHQEESLISLGLKCASDVLLDTIPRGFFSLLFILFCFSSLVHTSLWEKQSKAEQTSINVPGQTSYLQKPGYYGGNKGL